MDLSAFENLPGWQKGLVIGVLYVFVLGGIAWFVVYPAFEKKGALQTEVNNMASQNAKDEAKVRRLPELKKENERLQAMLTELKAKLPSDREVTSLLQSVSDLGNQSGLRFKTWKPGQRKFQGDLYEEIPIAIQVVGGFHNVGIFFNHISRLDRIVNISDIVMDKPVYERGILTVSVACTATTFASAEKSAAEAAAPAAPAKGPQKPAAAKAGRAGK
ncbi:MAG: type 4a pilus biogenesis protein PilO [Nitrospirota bacterium]